MSFDQVRMVAAVILFLAAVITAMWGTEIAGATAGAWNRGTAQAAAEKRRLKHAAKEARERNSAGRGVSGAFRQAKATAEGMRGAAKGASAWARKENGPARRIWGAAKTGAYVSAKGAGRAAAGAKRQAAKNRAASGSSRRPWTGRGSSGPGRGKSGSAGGSTGTRSRGGWRPKKVGVCDECGVTVGRASLKPLAANGPKMCFLCRKKHGPQAPGGTPVPGTASPRPIPSQAAPGALPAGITEPAGARPAPVGAGPSVPLPGAPRSGELPDAPSGSQPLPAAASATGELPAATAGTPAPSSVTPGNQQAITTGGMQAMTTARYGAIGAGSPGTGLAVRQGGAVASRTGGAVAPRGAATHHGEWIRNVQAVLISLARLHQMQKRMVEDLAGSDASLSQMKDVKLWADAINRVGAQFIADVLLIDGRLAPYIKAVMDAGGPAEVGSPAYQSDY